MTQSRDATVECEVDADNRGVLADKRSGLTQNVLLIRLARRRNSVRRILRKFWIFQNK